MLISEINTFRLRLASGLGLTAIDPMQTDLVEQVNEATGRAGADVVFEVSGSTAGRRPDDEAAANPRTDRSGRDLRRTSLRSISSAFSGAS